MLLDWTGPLSKSSPLLQSLFDAYTEKGASAPLFM